jgi:hypothetical protein
VINEEIFHPLMPIRGMKHMTIKEKLGKLTPIQEVIDGVYPVRLEGTRFAHLRKLLQEREAVSIRYTARYPSSKGPILFPMRLLRNMAKKSAKIIEIREMMGKPDDLVMADCPACQSR